VCAGNAVCEGGGDRVSRAQGDRAVKRVFSLAADEPNRALYVAARRRAHVTGIGDVTSMVG
jgi:hypothetical protein